MYGVIVVCNTITQLTICFYCRYLWSSCEVIWIHAVFGPPNFWGYLSHDGGALV